MKKAFQVFGSVMFGGVSAGMGVYAVKEHLDTGAVLGPTAFAVGALSLAAFNIYLIVKR